MIFNLSLLLENPNQGVLGRRQLLNRKKQLSFSLQLSAELMRALSITTAGAAKNGTPTAGCW